MNVNNILDKLVNGSLDPNNDDNYKQLLDDIDKDVKFNFLEKDCLYPEDCPLKYDCPCPTSPPYPHSPYPVSNNFNLDKITEFEESFYDPNYEGDETDTDYGYDDSDEETYPEDENEDENDDWADHKDEEDPKEDNKCDCGCD